jgi:molybdopterin synthase sulfur carrier subunit
MPAVQMTSHLHRFFPVLKDCDIRVPPGSVAQVLREVDTIAPGFTAYVLDERGALRRHVNISIDNRIVIDRRNLSDYVADDATLYIFQALTGG